MCRVVSFISASGGVGKTSLIFELSKKLAKRGYKVFDFDTYFGMNDLAVRAGARKDFRQYLSGELGTGEVLFEMENNFYSTSTNSATFDYLSHASLIKFFVEEISARFDYIFFDVNSMSTQTLSLFLECSNEVCLVLNDDEICIRNSVKLLQKTYYYKNITLRNAVLNKSKIIGFLYGKKLGKEDIEEILKIPIIFDIQKFYKNNIFDKSKSKKVDRKILDLFAKSFECNENFALDYRKKYCGILGILKKRFYRKYE